MMQIRHEHGVSAIYLPRVVVAEPHEPAVEQGSLAIGKMPTPKEVLPSWIVTGFVSPSMDDLENTS